MSQYKELADRLSTFINDEAFLDAVDEAAAILRSLDAQEPVLTVCKQSDYWHGGHFYEGTRPHIDPFTVYALPIGTKLYAAPVAAQPQQAKPLSDEQRTSIIRANKKYHDSDEIDPYGVIDDVEAYYGIKEQG